MANQEEKNQQNPFSLMEEEVLDFWDKAKTFEKSVEKPAPQGDYVFYDGPPFATGTPHYGHIVASLMKDAVPRYWTMRGFKVERKWGWDCHGLPIENIAEKELGFTQKKDIIAFGVDKFNEVCRSKVLGYVEEWEKVVRRLGRWADMENSYRTMDLEYMESVWWVFKQLWDKGLIYEGYRSIHVCPRCETTLSQQEVSEGYKDVKDLSAIAKFELVDEPGTFVLAWTTTPWTLIGNVALAGGADIDYVKIKCHPELVSGSHEVQHDTVYYVLAKEKLADVMKDKQYEIIEEFKGKEFVGKKYKPLFDYYAKQANLENKENGWQIYAGDFVTTEDGTGVVHIAPAFGEDDLNLGKQNNLPFVQHVGMDGIIKPEAGEFAGLSVKPIDDHTKTDIEIIKHLAHNGLLFHKEKYEHSYPHCWRCDTPLINYVTTSWFVNVIKVKDKALETAKEINWSPAHIKEGRFGNWLNGARDWSISRQRFWASVMPIWRCECGEVKVFGSVADLEKASGEKVTDLHKHIVDKITFKCEKCAGIMQRVPDVLDTWFDSGSMPYAQMHYPFENKEKFEANFPAKFIAEGVDQTRAWFYYLHVLSNAIKERPAFKNVIVNGIVLAEDGKKMSKRLNNYPDPSLIFDKYGADAMRYYLLSSPVMMADNFNFAEGGVVEALRKNNMVLWNVYKFYEIYAVETQDFASLRTSDNVLDKWILFKLEQLIFEVTDKMNDYDLPRSVRPITDFINDLSTWYIRRSRDRFKGESTPSPLEGEGRGEVGGDKEAALATTKYVLTELAKVMAPFMPFIAEQLWQKVTGNDFKDENKSVHLEEWPKMQLTITNDELKNNEDMELARKLVERILAFRDEKGIKVRQPLQSVNIRKHSTEWTPDDQIRKIVLEEVNIKEWKFFGDDVKSSDNYWAEYSFKNSDEEKYSFQLAIDFSLSEELILEGTKRELVRSINNLRKNANMSIQDRAIIYWQAESEMVAKVFAEMAKELKKDTLSNEIKNEKSEGVDIVKEVKVNDEMVWLGIKKV